MWALMQRQHSLLAELLVPAVAVQHDIACCDALNSAPAMMSQQRPLKSTLVACVYTATL